MEIIVLAIFLILGGTYLYLRRKGILSKAPGKPNYEIPITYNIGWWSYQNDLIIDEFNVEIVESKLNLFNSKSLISYQIIGKIKYKGEWKPSIKRVHISERLNKDTTQNCQRVIEITPVVKVSNKEGLNGGIEKFEINNEHLRTPILIACVLWLLLRFVIEMWFRRQASCLARNHNEEHEPQKKPLWVRLKHLSASL